jgi:hypothetical protein
MNRRNFLLTAAAATGGLMFTGFARRAEIFAENGGLKNLKAVGYGELIPTAAKNTGETILALPKGFEYTVVGKKGDLMKDGRPTPRLHDGMAAFDVKGEVRLVRNHEVSNKTPQPDISIGAANHYDESAGGGTTTLVINPKTRLIDRDFVSLSGTLVNCAGGRTPWGSWISCEETALGKTEITVNGKKQGGFQKPHGYCFEVSASADNNLPPVPLVAMGRFCHEAIAIDDKGIVYLTEDPLNYGIEAGFYRFIPKKANRLVEGGTLQMLAVKDRPNLDMRKGRKTGETFDAVWVTIDNPNPEEADVDEVAVYKQGKAKGGAAFVKLEGCFADRSRVYFVSSKGGDNGGGQIWLYERKNRDEGHLTLLFESPDRELLDMPDNICTHPKSRLLFMCEDSNYLGQLLSPSNYVRILTPDGKVADFARNIVPKLESSEFAGATFSRDGKTFFVNLQSVGVTLAIWGDWGKFRS